MKKITSLSLFLLLGLFTASAQEIKFQNYKAGDYKNTTSEQEKKGAGITQAGEATTWDYGTIQQNAIGVRYFKFVNTGKAPLIIQKADPSCGCVKVSSPTEPIMPDGTGYIQVTYDTKRVGLFTKYVTLTTNVISNEPIRLTLKGDVEQAP